MKKTIGIVALSISLNAFASTYLVQGIVIDSVPNGTGKYSQQCTQPQTQSDNSTGGAIAGGIIGAIIGNTVGQGHGNDAAKVAGAIGGAIVGSNMAKGSQELHNPNCIQTYTPPANYTTRVDVNGMIMQFITTQQYGERLRVNIRFIGNIQ